MSNRLFATRSIRIAAIGACLVVAGLAAYGLGVAFRPPAEIAGTRLENPPSVADVELQNAAGEAVRLGEFDGEMQLLFFGYTRCPDVCPLTLSRLAGLYRAGADPADVRVVMVTVDPQYDTPEIVQRYVEAFHLSFVGLSGGVEQVAAAAKRFYIGANEAAPGQISHTDMVVVVDGSGRFRWVYSQADLQYLERDMPALRAQL